MSKITYLIHPKVAARFQEEAKKLKKETGIKHTQALENVAKQHGFDNWKQITHSAKKYKLSLDAYQKGLICLLVSFNDEKKRVELNAWFPRFYNKSG